MTCSEMQHLTLSAPCSTTTAPHEGTFMLLSFEFKEAQTLPDLAAAVQEEGHILWCRQKRVKDNIKATLVFSHTWPVPLTEGPLPSPECRNSLVRQRVFWFPFTRASFNHMRQSVSLVILTPGALARVSYRSYRRERGRSDRELGGFGGHERISQQRV